MDPIEVLVMNLQVSMPNPWPLTPPPSHKKCGGVISQWVEYVNYYGTQLKSFVLRMHPEI